MTEAQDARERMFARMGWSPDHAVQYVATINTPGYLPMDDDPPVFDTAREAWAYLADERERGEDDYAEDDEDYSDTYQDLVSLANGYTKNGDEPGTIYGPTPGYDGNHDLGLAYSVDIWERDDES
jgi:hypothetical protein